MPAKSSAESTGREVSAHVIVPGRYPVQPCAIPVVLAGRHAQAALAAESAWSVLAVFRRSIYCRAARGAVICVGPPALGAGPLNVFACLPPGWSWQDFGATLGTRMASDGRALQFGGGLSLTWAQAPVWQAEAPPAVWDPVALSDGLDALAAECRRRAPVGGLAPAVLPLLPGRLADAAFSGLDRTLREAAAPGIAALRTWLASVAEGGDVRACPPQAVASLLGLGPGLTPSGDDLLGGALIALRWLRWSQAADALGSWLLPRARALTHAISYAHLACAAEGEGAAALHDALAVLSSPGSAGLGGRLDALATIGHSSGWDALAGMVLVAGVAVASRSADRPCRFTPPVRLSR